MFVKIKTKIKQVFVKYYAEPLRTSMLTWAVMVVLSPGFRGVLWFPFAFIGGILLGIHKHFTSKNNVLF